MNTGCDVFAVVAFSFFVFAAARVRGRSPRPLPHEHEAVRVATERFVDALGRADLDCLLRMFTDDASVFLPFPGRPGRLRGKENLAQVFGPFFEDLRKSKPGPVYLELKPWELDIRTYGHTAVVTFHLGEIPAEPSEPVDSFSRRTIVFIKDNGRWLIVHLHASNIAIAGSGE